jgi:NAD+ synthase (glutamine-hydrolysing)
VNQVGGQDELIFDGGSVVFDPDGELIARSPQFVEDLLVVDLDVEPVYRKRLLDPRGRPWDEQLPLVELASVTDVTGSSPDPSTRRAAPVAEPLSCDEEVYGALVLGTRDYVEKNGFSDVVIGLSGGIDSTLVAVVAVDALGANRVHGVSMPSRYSSDHSRSDAEKLASNLGIDYRTIAIEPAHAALLDMLAPSFEGRPADLTEENLQARIRGNLLMALSNKFGWLVLTTGNKSEMSVGYSTLYGDSAGGFAVIKDVPKQLVYRLTRHRDERAGGGLVPPELFTRAPSAELRPDQRDDDSLPPYEILDAILEGYVEHDLGHEQLVARGLPEADVERVIGLVDVAEYKRRQQPPGIKVTSRAFGRDRRVPITNRYGG